MRNLGFILLLRFARHTLRWKISKNGPFRQFQCPLWARNASMEHSEAWKFHLNWKIGAAETSAALSNCYLVRWNLEIYVLFSKSRASNAHCEIPRNSKIRWCADFNIFWQCYMRCYQHVWYDQCVPTQILWVFLNIPLSFLFEAICKQTSICGRSIATDSCSHSSIRAVQARLVYRRGDK